MFKTIDQIEVNYDGIVTERVFAVTITSRKKYNDLLTFRSALYNFLSTIEYKYAVKGFMEFHNQEGRQDKVHMHGVCYFGIPPKDNKKNPFNFRITQIQTPSIWDNYCRKEIEITMEKMHDIKTGMYNYRMKPVCLFDD